MKTFNFFLFVLLFGCEFRPPSHQFENLELEQTRCYYPIDQIHKYNDKNTSTITECRYSSRNTVKEELIFDATTTALIAMITYEYKYTYYLKTTYDYVNGNQDSHYITGVYFIDKDSI